MNAVVFGAGAVGRGLIARLLVRAGHHVHFAEKQPKLARALNSHGCYPVNMGSLGLELVRPVSASASTRPVFTALNQAACVFTCVRVENLFDVGRLLAAYVSSPTAKRLQVVVVENAPHAGRILATIIQDHTAVDLTHSPLFVQGIAECGIPDVDGTIKPFVPTLCNGDRDGFLIVPKQVEPILGQVQGVSYTSDIGFDWTLKWFCHCALHAVVAYVGLRRGYILVKDVMADAEFCRELGTLIVRATSALSERYGRSSDIAARFQREVSSLTAPGMPDTCLRVARDAKRKVQPRERLLEFEALVHGHPLLNEAIQQASAMANESLLAKVDQARFLTSHLRTLLCRARRACVSL